MGAVQRDEGWAAVEHYVFDTEQNEPDPRDDTQKVNTLFGMATLAQELWDKGLVGLVNQAVLHNYGYALGVRTTDPDEEGNRRVFGVSLYRSADPDGIWFGEDMVVEFRRKMLEAGLR